MEAKVTYLKYPKQPRKDGRTAYIQYKINGGALISRTLYLSGSGTWVLKRKRPQLNGAGNVRTYENVVWHDIGLDDYELVKLVLKQQIEQAETQEMATQEERAAACNLEPLPHKIKPPIIGLTEDEHQKYMAEMKRRHVTKKQEGEFLKQLLRERINQLKGS